MVQLHKRFSDEQVKVLLQGYCEGLLSAAAVQDYLDIGRSRFFSLVSEYREDPDGFSIAYKRPTPGRLGDGVEAEIEHELLREKEIVEDKRLPISGYNYSALRDRLRKKGIKVALNTIIDRAKRLGCHKPRKERKTHDREVLTAATGALIQHDSSYHLWSPFAKEKWYLVTSIDDFSRMLLFADFFPKETTWAHIQAVQALTQAYGIPVRYYVDSLRVFRFVQGRDSLWRKHVLQTDDVDTQWRKMMRVLGIDVRNALSPQAKGKIERPYRWLQDRIVRTCALEKISDLEDVRSLLRDELDRYNNHQVHSTTKEIPSIRFAKANQEGSSVFRPFLHTQALHVNQRHLLPPRDPSRRRIPTHLALQSHHRGPKRSSSRGSRHQYVPRRTERHHGAPHLVEPADGPLSLPANGRIQSPVLN
jgi:GNAT superfamily N-acetyltransferase